MQLDSMVSLAHAIHSRPGRYALLLGSGVSRAAGIPTGWEVIEDLVRKVRQLEGDTGTDDAISWYRNRFGAEPDYSTIVGKLGPRNFERQIMMKGYFEPAPTDTTDGKRPTTAHKAIARLMKHGYVRAVVTTNFDPLIENAAIEAGIQPTVVASDTQAHSALPLLHETPFVFKLHGDYRDPGFLNTADELRKYRRHTQRLLREVLERYGLVVCGWSADWDHALRQLLENATTRRFSTFWTKRGNLSHAAQSLVQLRDAEVISITDADQFFDDLAAKVFALESVPTAHPMAKNLAASEARRLVRHESDVPQLQRFVQVAVERVWNSLADIVRVDLPRDRPQIAEWIATSHRLLAEVFTICIPIARWAKGTQVAVLRDVVQRLQEAPRVPSHQMSPEKTYWAIPSFLVLHYIGASMAAGRNWAALFELLATTRTKTRDGFLPSVSALDWVSIQGRFAEAFGEGSRRLTASTWLLDRWNEIGVDEVPSSQDREEAFLRLELALAIFYRAMAMQQPSGRRDRVFIRDDTPPWAPPGLYWWKASSRGGERRFVEELKDDQSFTSALKSCTFIPVQPVEVDALYLYLEAVLGRTTQTFSL